jgi:hypothetical protein
METIIHQPDPDEKPESTSDEPTGEYSAADQTPAEPIPSPAGYPLPEEPLPPETPPETPGFGEIPTEPPMAPSAESFIPSGGYVPPAQPAIEPAGARAYSPPAAPPAYAPPPPQPAYTPSYAPSYAARSPKDRLLAIVLEVLPGLFGLLGIGWLYAGSTTAGVILLLGFLAWNFFAIILDVFTLGIFLCLHLPVNLVALILSPVLLYNYTKKHPELFGL